MPRKPKKPKESARLFTPEQAKGVTRILGLDLSLSSTGWVVVEFFGGDDQPELGDSGTLTTHFAGPARLLALHRQLVDLFAETKPQAVVVEGYSYGSPYNREAVAEWGGVVRMVIHAMNLPALVVAPQALKKFILPEKGKTEKQFVMLESFKRWGVQFASDDECDAHALAQLGWVRVIEERGDHPLPSPAPARMREAAMTAEILNQPGAIAPRGAARPIHSRGAAGGQAEKASNPPPSRPEKATRRG